MSRMRTLHELHRSAKRGDLAAIKELKRRYAEDLEDVDVKLKHLRFARGVLEAKTREIQWLEQRSGRFN